MIESKTYLLSEHPQGTEEWLKLRLGKITGTIGAKIIDGKDTDTILKMIRGEYQPTEEEIQRMQIGKYEGQVRKWFMKTHNLKVDEVGYAIWKSNTKIGCSVDGIIDDGHGIIEIKCTKKFSPGLEGVIKYGKSEGDYSHIYSSHFYQMQHNMGVLNRQYCIYIVLECKDNNDGGYEFRVYQEKVLFSKVWWKYMVTTYEKFIATHNL